MALQRRISKARNRSMIGREALVLVEGPSAETELLWEARTPAQAPEIDGVCFINDVEGDPPRVGQIRRMRVTEAHDYDLVGTILEEVVDPVRTVNPFPILASSCA
jgi:ribosomal protein S12 methylthiotransferase